MDNKLKITLLFKEIVKSNDKQFKLDETRSYMTKLANTAFNHCSNNPSFVWAIFEYLKQNDYNYKIVKNESISFLEKRNENVDKKLSEDVKKTLLEIIEKNLNQNDSSSLGVEVL